MYSLARFVAQYIKLDWCGDIKKQVFDGSSAHRDFANAVNKSGRAMYLEVVAGYFFLGRDVAEVANSYRFCEDHHDSWSSSSEAVTCRVDLNGNVTGAPGAWPFMDFLTTGGAGCAGASHCPGMTDDEYRTDVIIWALTQSPLIVATGEWAPTASSRPDLLELSHDSL